MILRSDVEFLCQGTICRGWLYLSDVKNGRPVPAIVMAHGLGGTRHAGLEPYARRFAEARYAVLLFDYRHFGASDGEPRQLLSVSRQLADWAAAIAFARRHPAIDAERIALWGTSFSGGHALVAGVRDGRVAAVAAQGPLMDGLSAVLNLIHYAGLGMVLRLVGAGLRDLTHAALGWPPVTVPIVAPPGRLATMSSHDAESGYRKIAPPDWNNAVAARLGLMLAFYRPIRYARRLPCPALILVCGNDTVAPASAAIATAKRAGDKAELKVYEGMGHFEIYVGDGFERSSTDQLAFFDRVLRGPTQPAR